MVSKEYDWLNGAELKEHSKSKHKIIREYFREYLKTRCQLPQREKFRLAIADGFAGGGRYKCDSPGSPIVFIETLNSTLQEININRSIQGHRLLEVECFFIFNDADLDVVEQLKRNCAPILTEIKKSNKHLHLDWKFLNGPFEQVSGRILQEIKLRRFRNILFNLDQYGHANVTINTIRTLMKSEISIEIFYTFAIEAFLTYLSPDKSKNKVSLAQHGIESSVDELLNDLMNKSNWLGKVEKIVFETHKECAPYVSPFSIHNPDGWRYWLVHFANSYRARQVYNDILHQNSSYQAHFGRSGLEMLSYDPKYNGGSLYLFDPDGRKKACEQLHDDIPKVILECGDAMKVIEFYETVYNATPSHSADIHSMMIENPDLEVITPQGGERRKANTISTEDIIRLKNQRSFFPLLKKN